MVSWDDSCLPNLRWWSDVSHLQAGLPLGSQQPTLFLFMDASDSGWGVSLGDDQLSSLWSWDCSSFSINHRELLALLYAVRGFLPSLQGHIVALYADNTTVLAYLKKQGGTRSQSLNLVAHAILRLCEVHHIQLLLQFIPGKLNVLADSLSHKLQVLGSEWTLCSEAFHQLLRRWPATIDLFATSQNHRLPVYFSPMVDPQSAGRCPAPAVGWPAGLCVPSLRVVAKIRQSRGLELTLVAPFWAQHPWFPDLLELLVEIPFFLPRRRDLLKQPHFHHYHQNLPVLELTAYRLSSDPHATSDSLRRWLVSLHTAIADLPE